MNIYKRTKRAFNIIKSIPFKDLKILGYESGLEMSHYGKNKILLCKGLHSRLGIFVPSDFESWK